MNKQYNSYYQSILKNKIKSSIQFVILTHIVSDVVEFISAIEKIGNIALLIAVPYSKDKITYKNQSKKYKTISPKLEVLLDAKQLINLVLENIDPARPLIIVEIGGYFASAISTIQKKINGNLIGVIEDTEAGHRKYEAFNKNLPCPVLSVARSDLKNAENFLVGRSCLKAVMTILDGMNSNFQNKSVLVLGYGKIGEGLSQLLKEKNMRVMVYDADPAKRLLALSRGYYIPEKTEALKEADFIFGASGAESVSAQDAYYIKNGAMLFSCSSKRVEFDINYMRGNFKKTKINQHVDHYQDDSRSFYVAGDGQPVNFACGKILVGPLISLVHGEMIAAASELSVNKYENKLQEIPQGLKKQLAENWINAFCNTTTGTYDHE